MVPGNLKNLPLVNPQGDSGPSRGSLPYRITSEKIVALTLTLFRKRANLILPVQVAFFCFHFLEWSQTMATKEKTAQISFRSDEQENGIFNSTR